MIKFKSIAIKFFREILCTIDVFIAIGIIFATVKICTAQRHNF